MSRNGLDSSFPASIVNQTTNTEVNLEPFWCFIVVFLLWQQLGHVPLLVCLVTGAVVVTRHCKLLLLKICYTNYILEPYY